MKLQVSLWVLVYLALSASFFLMCAGLYLRISGREYAWYSNATNAAGQLYNYTVSGLNGGIFVKG